MSISRRTIELQALRYTAEQRRILAEQLLAWMQKTAIEAWDPEWVREIEHPPARD